MPSVHRILIADPIHEEAKNLLLSRPGFEVAIATGLDEAELAERIGDYDGIIVRSKTRVSAPVVAAGHKLKVIGRAGIGVINDAFPKIRTLFFARGIESANGCLPRHMARVDHVRYGLK